MFHVEHREHLSRDWSPKRLHQALDSAGVSSSLNQCAALLMHGELVLDANQRMNLTRITDADDFAMLHIVDALAFLPHIDPPSGTVVDLGSGAGFPGIPLAIMGHEVTLCEATQKKARFLEECVAALGLKTEVLPLRAEEVALKRPALANVVVARAVSSLAALVELSAPLLGPEGRLIALKGVPDAEEVERGARAAAICGLRVSRSVSYLLESGERRSIYEYTKVAKPRIALPRRAGMAQKEPLG